MRAFLFSVVLTATACGPASAKCTTSSVGAVQITIDGVKDPTGAGTCAFATSSHIDIHIGGPQKLLVQLDVGADQTGSLTCDGPYLSAQIDGSGDGFATSMIGAQGYIAGGNRQEGTCTLDWTGVSTGKKTTGTFTGHLAKADKYDATAATLYKYADVTFGFSIDP